MVSYFAGLWRASTALALGLLSASTVYGAEPAATEELPPSIVAQEKASDARIVNTPKPDLSLEIEAQKSYAIPALEILGFDFLLNRFNRRFIDRNEYDSSFSSIKRNLRSSWNVDKDPFNINQLGHPYQGSMYHGFARSAGLNYWESLAYTFVGSAVWEVAGETTPPSRNDQITTGIGGTFLGEALFRMASLVLEKGDGPRFWREVTAGIISPATAFNRLAFDKRFDSIFASRNPAYYSRLGLGDCGSADRAGNRSTGCKLGEGGGN